MPEITKNRIKQIISLKYKNTREEQNLFIAEGEKIVDELLASILQIKTLIALKEWIESKKEKIFDKNIELLQAGKEELSRISSFKTPNKVLAIAVIPKHNFDYHILKNKISLVLDKIQDPGNLGTIIRLADWFGIQNIICSEDTVDLFNPKVIQATMGAFLRVKVFYRNLSILLKAIKKNYKIPVYGTFLNGNDIYTTPLSSEALIVFGNESKGISNDLTDLIDERITIPTFNLNKPKTESLNISIATAVICSEFRRRTLLSD